MVDDVIRIKAIDLDYAGRGVARHDGMVVFVYDLLPGEEAQVRIMARKARFMTGRVIERSTTSPSRSPYPLVHGAADLIHLSSEQQLDWQIKTTRETMRSIAGLDVDINDVIHDDRHFHYRNKSVFHVMDHDVLTLGLYTYDNQGLCPVETWALADETTNDLLACITKAAINVDPKTLKHIVIRTNPQGQALVTFAARSWSFKGMEPLTDCLKKQTGVVGITLNLSDNPKRILGSKSKIIYGENRLKEPFHDGSIEIDDRTFYQINLPVIQKVYDWIKHRLTEGATLIDAYSGVGVIGLYLADKVDHVTLIESQSTNIKMARHMCQDFQMKHIDIHHAKTEDRLDSIEGNTLVVDPPRNGLMPRVVDIINARGFQDVFYLSCDVKTLARDLANMMGCYEIQAVIPIRLFPQTTSIETLVHLKPKRM
ncbi:MAG: 23S rRNA (uracil(1939)-C(5))-methyltransferase RlmD [Acholeplasmataceae bacterium]|nr:MAG: 23S rRNA (uracil(1939)-C(5))-methyltransferase RlmD [Acholeplasmataceae bacterium]